MSYVVKWSSIAIKKLNKLPKNISLRVWEKVEEIKDNPFRFLKHYEGQSLYKLRIGDYRALVEVDQLKQILIIRILDKRGRIYKRL
jgi:mRNA interferase RelE/StbE